MRFAAHDHLTGSRPIPEALIRVLDARGTPVFELGIENGFLQVRSLGLSDRLVVRPEVSNVVTLAAARL